MSVKYQSREEKLKNKIKEELSNKQPNADIILKAVNEFEEANLNTIVKLNRQKKIDDNKIRGALKQTIHAHGPISMEFIGSATKRINGALLLSEAYNCPEPESPRIPIRAILLGIGIGMFILSLIEFLSR